MLYGNNSCKYKYKIVQIIWPQSENINVFPYLLDFSSLLYFHKSNSLILAFKLNELPYPKCKNHIF